MILKYNRFLEEWTAKRKNKIIAHSKSLDECIAVAINFFLEKKI